LAINLFSGVGRMFGARQAPITPTREVGTSGTPIFGGFIQVLEQNPKLVGINRYKLTSDIFVNTSIVAAGVRHYLDLVAKPKWTVDPVDDTPQAKEMADFAESCLYDLSASWSRTVRKAAEFRFHGFGLQEWTAKTRDDGKIGFESVEARPQHTIWRWEVDDQGNILGMYQRNPQNGQEIFLPRQKIIYLVDDSMTDSPEGVGVLRHLVDPAQRLKEYLDFESSGFETDLRGIPVAKVPLSELSAQVKAGSITKDDADKYLKPFRDFVNNHIRSRKSGLVVDSKPYYSQGNDPSPSSTLQTDVSLMQGGAQSFADVGRAIQRLNHEMAVILGVEGMLLGSSGGGGSGSRALGADKSEHLYTVVNSALGEITQAMDRDFIGPLWLMNGLDDKLKPTLSAEDVQFKDVTQITGALYQMAQAGAMLAPDDPAIDDVRGLLGISPAPTPDPAMMGIRTRPSATPDPNPNLPVNPDEALPVKPVKPVAKRRK
jgi:hypothetical protein